jgi:uroporphyrinogen III methyltransferase/synthase
MAPRLNWYESLPLFGKRVLITRPKERSDELLGGLEALGAEVETLPMIQSRSLLGTSSAQELLIEGLSLCELVVFSSKTGVEVFFEAIYRLGRDSRALSGARVAAVGQKTAEALREFGVIADIVPKKAHAEALLEAILSVDPQPSRVFIPRAKEGRFIIEEGLKGRGIEVFSLESYETTPVAYPLEVLEELDPNAFQWLIFASPSAVTQFLRLFSRQLLKSRERPRLACIGLTTANALNQHGLKVDAMAKESSSLGLIAAIVHCERQKEEVCFP